MWPLSRKTRTPSLGPASKWQRWWAQLWYEPAHRQSQSRAVSVLAPSSVGPQSEKSHIQLAVAERGSKKNERDFGYWDDEGGEPPSFSPITLKLLPLPDDGRVAVVGESHYQQALNLVTNGRASGDDFDHHIPVTAALVPEPDNRWDKNAVRVDVVVGDRTVKVGYLSKDLAQEYQPELLILRKKGFLGTCPARIAGGGSKYYGIYLHVIYPEDFRVANRSEHPVIAEEANGAALLRSDRSCTVTKEENHQDVLNRYAPKGEQDFNNVVVSLGFCEIKSGKYQGRDAIEVRLDGHRVGQLTYAMTQRYGDIVNDVLNRNLIPTCDAVVMNTEKGVQLELGMPRDPKRLPQALPSW